MAQNEEREKQWLEQDNESDKNDEPNNSIERMSAYNQFTQSKVTDGAASAYQTDSAKSGELFKLKSP